jgi:hypothetical protein
MTPSHVRSPLPCLAARSSMLGTSPVPTPVSGSPDIRARIGSPWRPPRPRRPPF